MNISLISQYSKQLSKGFRSVFLHLIYHKKENKSIYCDNMAFFMCFLIGFAEEWRSAAQTSKL